MKIVDERTKSSILRLGVSDIILNNTKLDRVEYIELRESKDSIVDLFIPTQKFCVVRRTVHRITFTLPPDAQGREDRLGFTSNYIFQGTFGLWITAVTQEFATIRLK